MTTPQSRNSISRSPVLLGFILIPLLLLCFGIASAAAITVTNNNDNGPGSLRQAISDASPGDTIDFDTALNGQTILLTTGELLIDKTLAITGPGANLLAVDGNHSSRVFNIGTGFGDPVTIFGLTITGGFADSGGAILNDGSLTITNSNLSANSASSSFGGFGGGIYNNGLLTITNSTLSDNSANPFGGGIYIGGGSLTITNSTLSTNSASISGGGIYNGGGSLTITNSTLSSNSAPISGGGIYNDGGSLIITNSTLSGNEAAHGGGGGIHNATFLMVIGNTILKAGIQGENIVNFGSGRVTSLGYNISSDDAGGFLTQLGDQTRTDPQFSSFAPQDNGGPTFTLALSPGSPAIDAGDPNFNPNDFDPPLLYDQRGPGFSRVVGSFIDIGAFEVQAEPTPTPTPSPTPTPTPTATSTPSPTADLLVGLGVDNPQPRQGDLITYTITVRNFGPSDAANVVMNDVLSSGTTFYSAQANRGHFTAPPSGQTGTVTWYLADLLNNGQESAQIRVTVIVRGRTTITNTASVTSNTADPNTANNTTSITTSVAQGGGGHGNGH